MGCINVSRLAHSLSPRVYLATVIIAKIQTAILMTLEFSVSLQGLVTLGGKAKEKSSLKSVKFGL